MNDLYLSQGAKLYSTLPNLTANTATTRTEPAVATTYDTARCEARPASYTACQASQLAALRILSRIGTTHPMRAAGSPKPRRYRAIYVAKAQPVATVLY